MNVNVKLYAIFRKFAPKDTPLGESFKVSLESNSVSGLMKQLGIPLERGVIIMVNGIRITELDQKLKPDDLIVIFPQIGGG